MSMRRRRRQHASDLTPLIDVLFIVLFAALVQTRVAREHAADTRADATPAGAADAGPDATPVDAMPADAGILDAAGDAGSPHLERALAVATEVARAARHRDVFVVEVGRDGLITAMSRWNDGHEVRRDRPNQRLLRPVLPAESNQEFAFRGAGDPGLRICSLVRQRFAPDAADLGHALVIVVVDAAHDELPVALDLGLADDIASCFHDAGGSAILLDPEDDHDPR